MSRLSSNRARQNVGDGTGAGRLEVRKRRLCPRKVLLQESARGVVDETSRVHAASAFRRELAWSHLDAHARPPEEDVARPCLARRKDLCRRYEDHFLVGLNYPAVVVCRTRHELITITGDSHGSLRAKRGLYGHQHR